MADIGLSVASKIAEYLVVPATRHLSYVFCFASNVEDLGKEAEKLAVAQGRLQNDVNEAIRQTEEIEKDVEYWLTEAKKVLEDVKTLETEIEENKRCFNWCPSWHWRYQLSKEVAKKKLLVVKLQETSKFQRVGHRATLPVIEFLPSKDFMPSKSSEKAFNQIMEALMDDEVSMIGMYGMAGVGKTTLAKEVGKKARQLKLFDLVVIAVVSQTPDIRNIQGRIADLLDLRFEKETNEGRAAQLWHRLQEMKKILIILDDVWKELNLRAIGIPRADDHKGCKVLFTTRLQDVCIRMRSQKKIQLDVLSNDEAWALFKRNAGLHDGSGYGELRDVARKVAGECKGLPLAIVTIARALREKTLDEWIVANQQLERSQLSENQDVCEDIYGCLKFSYYYLRGRKSKSCFLLCSLFPEDYEISVEQLTRYGIGQGLFEDVNFIEDARREIRVILTNLQNSGLLLDTGNAETVKMHDVVRDFAHWIASEGKNVSMIKAGLGLDEWPNTGSLRHCTTISLMNNKIKCIPDELVCPNLETLLLSGNDRMGVSSASFVGMKRLKVLTLCGLSSVGEVVYLTNLKCLCLERCKLKNITLLGQLKKLEILAIRASKIDKMTDELGGLNSLRLLDLSYVEGHWMIPPNLLQRLSKLEELYIGDYSFRRWAIEGTSEQATTASLSELKSVSRLTALTMHANSICLPKDFVFPKLRRYKISINQYFERHNPRSRSLKIERFSLSTFEDLFCNVEYLDLDTISGHQCLVPSLDHSLNELIFLRLRRCKDIKCLIHTVNKHVPATVLFNLEELFMEEMICLEELCTGVHPKGFLHKLEKFTAENCAAMISTVPVVRSLKEVTVINCPKLLAVFQFDSLLNTEQENQGTVLSNLTCLELWVLPNLRCIWERPVDHVSLQSLKAVTVQSCNKLTSLFPPMLAQVLLQLETLEIRDCPGLKHVIMETIDSDSYPLCLPKLTTLKISSCDILEYVLPNLRCIWEGPVDHVSLQSLKAVTIQSCNKLTSLFPPMLVQGLLQLETLEIRDCPGLKHVIMETIDSDSYPLCLPKLTTLKISSCDILEYVFPISTATDFPQLKEINIANSTQLKRIFCLGKQMDGKDIFLSQLRSLVLKNLKNLSSFGPENCVILQPSLEVLEVEECPMLANLIFEDMTRAQIKELWLSKVGNNCQPGNRASFQGRHRSMDMEYLTVGNCIELFQLEGGLFLSSLEKLHLKDLQELQVIWRGPKQIATLQNLTHLEVVDCKRLRHIFSPMFAPNFLQLKELNLQGCEELEQIIAKDQTLLSSSKGHLQSLSFPNLTKIWINNCNKLKCVFPVSAARSLPKLEELKVEGASTLEQVFGHEDEANTIDEEDMVLPKLRRLELLQLPNLVSFSPLGYQFLFPSWFVVTAIVEDCPNMTICFTVDVNNLMQGRTQKLSLREENNCSQLSKTLGEGEHFLNLRELKFNNCGVAEVFQLKGHLLPTTIQELKCYCSISRERKWQYLSDFYGNVSLKYLTTLELSNCKRLKKVFSLTLARNLPNLKHLSIWDCEDLELIVAKDDSNGREQMSSSSSSSMGHFQPICFCSLHEIKIRRCNKLESLFPVGVALPHLEKIMVEGASELELVFGDNSADDEEGGAMEDKVIVLPMLWMLDLLQLPRLNNFCSVGYDFVIPYLSSLNVKIVPSYQQLSPLIQNIPCIQEQRFLRQTA